MKTPHRPALLVGLLLGVRLACSAAPVDFPNAGFEAGLQNWQASDADKTLGLSQAKPEAARTGSAGLRVVQKGDEASGSWLQSSRLPLEPGRPHTVAFMARVVETSGIGVWVQFYDDERHVIKPAGEAVVLQLKPAPSDWTRHELVITPPPGASWATLAVHGYSKHAVLADFDDFFLTPVEASAGSAPAAAR